MRQYLYIVIEHIMFVYYEIKQVPKISIDDKLVQNVLDNITTESLHMGIESLLTIYNLIDIKIR
jgi:hypothetical protein